MKKLIFLILFFMFFSVPANVYADDPQLSESVKRFLDRIFEIEAEEEKHFKSLINSAEKGDSEAQYKVGAIYEKGKGGLVLQDYKEAAKWFKISAGQGNSDAMVGLGMIYYEGKGVIQNFKEASKWFVDSASKGNVEAQFHLARMNEKGQGFRKDLVQAHVWYNIAASNGHSIAFVGRDNIAKGMTGTQINKAQKLAEEWVKKHQKN